MFETVEIEDNKGVATIWMNRPDVHNAFNAQVIADLTNSFRTLAAMDSVRIVILAGRGKSFSAGADLHWMKAAGEASFEANLDDARRLTAMLRTLAELTKPTIARVQGAALGGGMGLAAASDICVASTKASFAHIRGEIRHYSFGDQPLCRAGDRCSSVSALFPDRRADRRTARP